ncbi:hypothetical protein [Kiloniella laminariae]|uniref:hypothetical protein n=1 Tax=Kiloniella laminariae TaxID=454162 RepID=UPI0003672E55|nr:hypothetical protein [Kiloniella laminariae]
MHKLFLLPLCLWAAGCSYQGNIDKPHTQKATWFSYVGGEDIRQRCQPGMTEYRFVYNAVYDEQIRTYEVTGVPGDTAELISRAQEGSGVRVNHISLSDPLAQFGWKKSQRSLSREELAELEQMLQQSGAGELQTEGDRLRSDDFYWTSALCHDGNFVFNGWKLKDKSFDHLAFVPYLLNQDQTGVAVNPIRDMGTALQARMGQSKAEKHKHFELRVGNNGLTNNALF